MGGPVHFPSPHAPALDNDQTGALLDPRLDDEPLGAHVLGGPPSPLVSFQGSFHDGPAAGMPCSPLLLHRIHTSLFAVQCWASRRGLQQLLCRHAHTADCDIRCSMCT